MRAKSIFFAALLSWALLGVPAVASDDDLVPISFADNELVDEFVGQVTNFPPTPSAPLGSSNQYGYLSVVPGINNVFSGSPHNETTAVLTFFNEVTTTESISDGPLRIIDRDGTTTIYLNNAPASFSNPDSFRSGTPVQTSKLHQQAIVDTAGGTFTAVFFNNILSTEHFQHRWHDVQARTKGTGVSSNSNGTTKCDAASNRPLCRIRSGERPRPRLEILQWD
jgi:hypothetical protein